MLLAVISAGTQNADVSRQYTPNELDVVVDSARLFDRCVLGLGHVLEYSFTKNVTVHKAAILRAILR